MNSIDVCSQFIRHKTGSIMPNLVKSALLDVRLPVVDDETASALCGEYKEIVTTIKQAERKVAAARGQLRAMLSDIAKDNQEDKHDNH